VAAIVTIAVASAAALAMIILGIASPLAAFLMVAMFFGAFFYSVPPLSLATTGWGELAASVVVAGLVPAFGVVVLGGALSMMLVTAVVSLVALHFAMILAFEIPDEPSDRAANKRTLLVRMGSTRAAALHNAALLVGILVGIVAPWALGMPRAAMPAVAVAPLALWQASEVRRLARGQIVPLGRITTIAVAIFSLTAGALAAVFWSL
jgi:1,4-dihydroxy-2-naphthoate octaprenyltransferase